MLIDVQATNQAKILIVFFLGWERFCVYLTKGLFHTVRLIWATESWRGCTLVLIASVHRGIETVSTALLHIRTNLPLSNFIQPWLVTAEERCVLWAEALTSRHFPVMHRGGKRRELAVRVSRMVSFSVTNQEINLFCGKMSDHTDRCVENHLAQKCSR